MIDDVYPPRGASPAAIERRDPVVYWPDRPSTRMQRDDRLRRFERDGYLFLPELFFQGAAEALHQEAENLRQYALSERPEIAFFEADSEAIRSVFAVHRHSRCSPARARNRSFSNWCGAYSATTSTCTSRV